MNKRGHSRASRRGPVRKARKTASLPLVVIALLGVLGVAAWVRGAVTPRSASLAPAQPPGAVATGGAVEPTDVVAPTDALAAVTAVEAEDGLVALPVSDLVDNQARFYTYDTPTTTVTFFVMRSSDGVIRAAFDACDVCYLAKKGYHQEGDEMVCNNCGSRFPSNQINEVQGGCNPSPIPREVDGETITLQAADIEAGAMFF